MRFTLLLAATLLLEASHTIGASMENDMPRGVIFINGASERRYIPDFQFEWASQHDDLNPDRKREINHFLKNTLPVLIRTSNAILNVLDKCNKFIIDQQHCDCYDELLKNIVDPQGYEKIG
ncbi:hypothetical protein BJ684DRAFT_22117, partial [Piptocephalis cylindrospora]